MAKRLCKCGCGSSIDHKHPNAKFINLKHKDKHHNRVNPRGKFAHLAYKEEPEDLSDYDDDPSWDAHKDSW